MIHKIMVAVICSVPCSDVEWHIEANSLDQAFDIAWDRATAISRYVSDPTLSWWEGVYDKEYYERQRNGNR